MVRAIIKQSPSFPIDSFTKSEYFQTCVTGRLSQNAGKMKGLTENLEIAEFLSPSRTTDSFDRFIFRFLLVDFLLKIHRHIGSDKMSQNIRLVLGFKSKVANIWQRISELQ